MSNSLSSGQLRAARKASPFTGPALVAVLGDSISLNVYATTNIGAYRATGFITWAMGFSMGALWCPLVWEIGNATPKLKYNRSVTGETAAQAAARITEIDALPVKPRFCSVMTGTNNLTVNTSQTAASITAEITGLCDALLRRGIIPVLCTLLPRGNSTSAGWSALTSGQIATARGRLHDINRMLRSYASATPGVILADVWSSVVNFASSTSDPLVTYAADYLHPTAPGAIRVGQAWWQAVAPYASVSLDSAYGDGDAWSTSDNPFGSHLNGAWGSSGGTAGTGTSGTVPNGWTANRFAGSSSTAVVAQQARADGKNGYETTIAMTGSDTAAFRLYQGGSTLTNGNFSAGDAFYAECDVVFSGTGANQYANPDLELRLPSGTNTAWAAVNTAFADGDIQGSYTFRLRTPLIEVPSGGLSGTNSIWTWDGIKNGGSATVTRRNMALRKYNKSAPGAVTW